MKRRLLGVLLALTMCVSLIPATASASSYYTTLTPEAAAAYLGLLDPIQKKYGIAGETRIGAYYTGLVAADLIDFDGDGAPELYYCYVENNLSGNYRNAYHNYLYTYRDGKLVNLGLPETRQSQAQFPHIGIYLDTNAAYLQWDEVAGDAKSDTFLVTYYGVEDGKLVKSLYTQCTYTYSTKKTVYIVNGVTTNSAAFSKRIQNFTKSKTLLWHNFGREQGESNESKTLVNATLSTLRSASAAKVSTASITLDGKTVTLGAYNIGGNNYFKLRDLAALLDGTDKTFSVTWNNESKRIDLVSGERYTKVGGELASLPAGDQTANGTTATVCLDGKTLSLTVYNIGGNNYFKLRDLGQAMDFGVGWDNTTKTISISTTTGYTN